MMISYVCKDAAAGLSNRPLERPGIDALSPSERVGAGRSAPSR